MAKSDQSGHRPRSVRYPGAPLADCVAFCRELAKRGLDGLSAAEIASGLGYRNLRTNTFSARLSAARQFGLLALKKESYSLTPLARAILEARDPTTERQLYQEALRQPPLYAALIERLAGKRVPDLPALATLLHRQHQITASAQRTAAEAFLESARFAGALGSDQVLADVTSQPQEPEVTLDLRLWGPDAGKVIQLRAPASLTAESFERFLQAFKLMVRIIEK